MTHADSMHTTVPGALAGRATTDPEAPFVIGGQETVTFGELEARAESLAASLHSLGIEAGDRVAIVMPAWIEFVVSMFAVSKVGAVLVPLNPYLTGPELQYMLRHSEAVAAITAEDLGEVDFLQLFEELLPQLPDLQYLITVGEEDLWYDDRIFQYEDLLSAGAGRDYLAPELSSSDLFAILYTSGTTGKQKGVELTHGNLLHAALATVGALEVGPDDRVIGVSALHHVFGLGPGLLGCLATGAALILQETFEAAITLDLIEKHGATIHYGVPTLFVTELHEQRESPRDVSSLRRGLVAGAPMSDALIRQVEDELCPELMVAYSLTECGSTVSLTRPDLSPEKRYFTVGRPIERTLVKILDPEGVELPVESVGEIGVRGDGVMRGYYRQPQETSNWFDSEGFFRTGDLGIVDDEGFLHLVGRRKEVIIRSGFSVYPREVESRISAHPAVREAVVVGIPDDVLGEAICACVVPIEGAIVTDQEIRDWSLVTLAEYKVPDVVRFLEEFPLTGTGKVRRVEVSRLVQETSGGTAAK
jgi:fatty-acyl-CoA synthase